MSTLPPLRVALLTTAFPRWPNDSRGPSMLETARALRDQGVQVRVVTLHGPGSHHFEVFEGIPVYRQRYGWPDRMEGIQDIGGGLPAAWKRGWFSRLSFGPLFLALIWGAIWHGISVDVIHAHWTLAGLAAWIASFLTHKPFVLTVHGSDVYIAPGIPGVASVTRAMLSRCARVLAVSRDLAQTTADLGFPAEQIEVLPDGIDLDRFTPGEPEREPLLLFVGSLIHRKGVDVLLNSFAEVRLSHPGARLAIVGDGPERKSLEIQAAELGLSSHVTFVGTQSQKQISQWMQKAFLFLLPSREEALGIVLLEALASATPCVASRVGGVVDIVTDEVGVLVPPEDPSAMASAIVHLLQDQASWSRLQKNTRSHVERHCWTWKRVAERLIAIYRDAANWN